MTLLVAGACTRPQEAATKDERPAVPVVESSPATTPADAETPPGSRGSIVWWENDVEGAVAAAQRAGRPILVDMWAPWCHTCLSMQAKVLVDPRVVAFADRYTWLAVDTDRPENASVVERLEMSMWPTFFILDPTGRSVLGIFGGAASAAQFEAFLGDGLEAAGTANVDPLAVALASASQAVAQGRHEAARAALQSALAKAPANWPRRADVLVELARTLDKQGSAEGCAALGSRELASVAASRAASTTDFVLYISRCIESLPAATRDELRGAMRDALVALSNDAAASLSVDDRSDLLYNLRRLQETLGADDAAKTAARRQRDLLKRAYDAAGTPEEAKIYAWPRAEVHVYLGEGEALIPDLERLAQTLPDAYDPPYRLGWLLHKTGRSKAAVEPLRRALARVYGPRKAHVWATLAEVYEALGRRSEALEARRDAVAHLERMPTTSRNAKALVAAKTALRELETAG